MVDAALVVETASVLDAPVEEAASVVLPRVVLAPVVDAPVVEARTVVEVLDVLAVVDAACVVVAALLVVIATRLAATVEAAWVVVAALLVVREPTLAATVEAALGRRSRVRGGVGARRGHRGGRRGSLSCSAPVVEAACVVLAPVVEAASVVAPLSWRPPRSCSRCRRRGGQRSRRRLSCLGVRRRAASSAPVEAV